MPKRRPPVKECVKRFHGRCLLCAENVPEVLDGHRPLPGSAGGRYVWGNIMTLCATCHRKVHAGLVTIHGRYLSTAGYYVWHCTVGGVERWVPDTPKGTDS
jgi:hypothetical protein